MKVLAIIDNLSNGGGAERLLVTLLPVLRAQGVHCDLAVIRDDHDLAAELEAAGVRVFKLGVEKLWSLHASVRRLSRLCRQEDYDILWGHSYFGNLNAMLVRLLQPGRKAVVFLESAGYAAHPPKSWGHYASMKIEYVVGSCLSSRIVAVSRAMAEDFASTMGWKDIAVVNNCVPMNAFPPPMTPARRAETRAAYGLPLDEFVIVVPARFVPMKGHSVLIDALRILAAERSWRPYCVLAGRGPLIASLQSKSSACGLDGSVRFIDTLPQAEIFRMMQAADAVVLPSLYEPFGVAAAEAMAMGIPTLITDAYGFKDLAGDGETVFRAAAGDPRSLADALCKLREDASGRARVAAAGRRRVQDHFDAPIIAAAWREIFATTLA